MYIIRTPRLIQSLFPLYNWKVNTEEKVLYLTFDDGPIPGVTPAVLDILDEYQAKATFFCVGENVKKHPEIFGKVVRKGHAVGSHTYNHMNGWGSDVTTYISNVRQGATLIKSDLFRPPYGRIRPNQAKMISRHYKIIMWDVLSGDFDHNNTPETCYQNVVDNANPGSVVVFHDSLKSEHNVLGALPKILNYFTSMGYRFEALSSDLFNTGKFKEPKLSPILSSFM